jgi:hypothetical protein
VRIARRRVEGDGTFERGSRIILPACLNAQVRQQEPGARVVRLVIQRGPDAEFGRYRIGHALVDSGKITPEISVITFQRQGCPESFECRGQLRPLPLEEAIMAQGGCWLLIPPEKCFKIPRCQAQSRDETIDISQAWQCLAFNLYPQECLVAIEMACLRQARAGSPHEISDRSESSSFRIACRYMPPRKCLDTESKPVILSCERERTTEPILCCSRAHGTRKMV